MTNRNKLVRFFITYPHANSSSKFPNSDTSKEDFVSVLSSFDYKTLLVVEEPHRKSSGNHFHAVLILNKGLTFKFVLNKLQLTYPDASDRIDISSCKSPSGSYRYLTQIGYIPSAKRSDSTFIPKGVPELDAEPVILGSLDSLIPKDLFLPFSARDWARLIRVCDPSGILLDSNWESAKQNPFLKI